MGLSFYIYIRFISLTLNMDLVVNVAPHVPVRISECTPVDERGQAHVRNKSRKNLARVLIRGEAVLVKVSRQITFQTCFKGRRLIRKLGPETIRHVSAQKPGPQSGVPHLIPKVLSHPMSHPYLASESCRIV